jgi:hypothetical protein
MPSYIVGTTVVTVMVCPFATITVSVGTLIAEVIITMIDPEGGMVPDHNDGALTLVVKATASDCNRSINIHISMAYKKKTIINRTYM